MSYVKWFNPLAAPRKKTYVVRCVHSTATAFWTPHCHRTIPIRHTSSFASAELMNSKAKSPYSPLPLATFHRETIFALSTPPGKGGIAVIRVSGPQALEVWNQVIRCKSSSPTPWKLQWCRVIHPVSQEVLDNGLAVFFQAPKSYTAEDVIELHIHSGRALINSVLAALNALPSCRPAEAGEFTRRAFEAGRLDLTQVEGIHDLINANTDAQRRQAIWMSEGRTRVYYEGLRRNIIRCLAHIEAIIDFGDTEDVDEDAYEQARALVQKVRTDIVNHLGNKRGEIIRTGVKLAIFGPPNAGKSSLLNFLAQRDAAIVTPIPGTTRDVLEVTLDLDGLPVVVSDTAGLRSTDDVVEAIGVQRARQTVDSADVPLCVIPLSEHNSCAEELQDIVTPDTLVLFNKTDLIPANRAPLESYLDAWRKVFPNNRMWMTSLTSGHGAHEFLKELSQELRLRFGLAQDMDVTETPYITQARHRSHLESAERFLSAFLETPSQDVVLAAEELRYATQAIGQVSGLIDTENILDSIFKDFCIGK